MTPPPVVDLRTLANVMARQRVRRAHLASSGDTTGWDTTVISDIEYLTTALQRAGERIERLEAALAGRAREIEVLTHIKQLVRELPETPTP